MPDQFVLEICVESAERAIAAERGGADRVELCTDLRSGGITPSAGLMEIARDRLRIPIHVLIRPRAGGFVYSEYELQTMERDIAAARRLGMDGIVLGLLNGKQEVDVERTARLAALARPLPVTFHRAFDLCPDRYSSLQSVIQTGARRLLTSGDQTRAIDGVFALARLVREAGNQLVIMPGGGIDAGNVGRVLQETGAREVHTSLGMSVGISDGISGGVANGAAEFPPSAGQSAMEFEEKVRQIRKTIETALPELSRRD